MRTAVKNLLAILFWCAVWYVLALFVHNPLLLPTPLQVLIRLGELAVTADFWQTTLFSLGRILLGIFIVLVLSVLLAVLTCSVRWIDALISPLMTAIQASPIASFSFLVLIWIDRAFVPVLICILMVLPIVWSNVCTGIRGVDSQLLEMAQAYRLPWGRKIRRIYIPSVMPHFRTGCSNALGLGWKAGVAAEVLTVPKASIGKMIADAKLYLQVEDLFAWTLAVILLSLLLQKLMMLLLVRRDGHA